MRTFRAKKGPSKVQTYFSEDEIELMCEQELRSAGLMPSIPEPIRIERYIEKRFNLNVSYESLQGGILGYSKFGNSGVESIVVCKTLDDEGTKSANRRIRTTLAHEAGHCLLHAHLFVNIRQSEKIFEKGHDKTPRVLCRDDNNIISGGEGTYRGHWWEYQANMVMSSILIPKALLNKALEPFLDEGKKLGSRREPAIKTLSDVFDVNPVVVRLRLSKLNF